jgi:acyl-CoA synthetase (AMP-forming)/AMP-acid ligase II
MTYADMSSTVGGVLDACDRFPDMLAVRDDEVEWTFAELRVQILAAVRAAMAWGVEPGDRVGLCASNSARWIVAALGVQGAGGVLVPLNTRFKGEELGFILATSGATRLLVEDSATRVPMIRAAGWRSAAVDSWLDLGDPAAWGAFLSSGTEVEEARALAQVDVLQPTDLSDILFTSGTTGYPKGVPFTHGQSLRAYGELGDAFGYGAGDRFLLIPPFFHALGYKSGWFAGLLHGSAVLPEKRFDSERMLDRIERERVTMMIGPPTVFEELLAHPNRAERDLSSLRLVVPSATNVPPELVRRMRAEIGIEHVLTGYGLTECSAVVSYSHSSDDPERVADSVGRPAPGVEVTIVDDDGRPVPVGERGDILVRGYVVMSGYWQDPAATAATISDDGWLRTGDIGSFDEHGFLRITGRRKDVLMVGGFNVYPAEVERVLTEHPSVGEVAVVAVPDERLGEAGFAFVVPADGQSFDAAEFLAWARERMATYKVPRFAEAVDELPRNPSMKILRGELRAQGARRIAETVG